MRNKRLAVLGAAMMLALVMAPGLAFGAETAAEPAVQGAAAPAPAASDSYLGLALGFGLALAAFGGAIGQSRAIAAAVDASARQPEIAGKIQTTMIIGLALIETLVIYMLLICFMWGGKIGN